MPSKARPKATIHLNADAVTVATPIGDLALSHGAVCDALKKAGIKPAHFSLGFFKITFAPDDTRPEEGVAIVETALLAAGIRVSLA